MDKDISELIKENVKVDKALEELENQYRADREKAWAPIKEEYDKRLKWVQKEMHDAYVAQRKACTIELKMEYDRKRKILENKQTQLAKLISGNVTDFIMNPSLRNEKVNTDYVYKSPEEFIDEQKGIK